MKNCELCKLPANAFCESDKASLCWNCDSKVHGANFLVARHSRTLLCCSCYSPTHWKASGAKLGHATSICDSCSQSSRNVREEQSDIAGDVDEGNINTDDDDDDDDGRNVSGNDEDAENRVVPWSSTQPPPSPVGSSTSQESLCKVRIAAEAKGASENLGMLPSKRTRDHDLNLPLKDDDLQNACEIGKVEGHAKRPMKNGRTEADSVFKKQTCHGTNTCSGGIDLNYPQPLYHQI